MGQTAMQVVGVLCIILWTTVTSTILFGLLKAGNLLRASHEAEIRGLDLDHHMGYTGILRYEQELELTNMGTYVEDVVVTSEEHGMEVELATMPQHMRYEEQKKSTVDAAAASRVV